MELYVFCLLGVMILTTVIIKGIFCWMHCYDPAPWESRSFIEKRKKELSISKSRLVHMEIPMEDMERTSTPVPTQEKKPKFEYQSDV